MIHYSHVEDWFDIKNRGLVACIKVGNPECSWDIFFEKYSPSTGDEVCIEGNVYTALGIETFKPGCARENEPIGILVGRGTRKCEYHPNGAIL